MSLLFWHEGLLCWDFQLRDFCRRIHWRSCLDAVEGRGVFLLLRLCWWALEGLRSGINSLTLFSKMYWASFMNISLYRLFSFLLGIPSPLIWVYPFTQFSWIPPVRDTHRRKVRSGVRKRAKKEYEAKRGEYRQRIEQVIGKIKNAYGRLERTKSYEMAVNMG